MVSHCCCGERCTLKGVPAGDKHWCPGCKQPIHAVCGALDESQDSIAYMSWCHDCHEGRKMPSQQVAAIKQKRKRSTTTRKKSPSRNLDDAEAKIDPSADKQQPTSKKAPTSKKPTKSNKTKFKIVAPTQQADPLTALLNSSTFLGFSLP